MKSNRNVKSIVTSGSKISPEMTRHVNDIFDKLSDPVEKQKLLMKKQREEILEEKLNDYNL